MKDLGGTATSYEEPHDPDNVGRWCKRHHRLFHEGGWTIRLLALGAGPFPRGPFRGVDLFGRLDTAVAERE